MPDHNKTGDSSTTDDHSCTIPRGPQTSTVVANGGYACFSSNDASSPTLHQCKMGKWIDKGTPCTVPVNGIDGSPVDSDSKKGS